MQGRKGLLVTLSVHGLPESGFPWACELWFRNLRGTAVTSGMPAACCVCSGPCACLGLKAPCMSCGVRLGHRPGALDGALGGALAPGCGVPSVHLVSFLCSHSAFSSRPRKGNCSSSGRIANQSPAPTPFSLSPDLQDCSIYKAEK